MQKSTKSSFPQIEKMKKTWWERVFLFLHKLMVSNKTNDLEDEQA